MKHFLTSKFEDFCLQLVILMESIMKDIGINRALDKNKARPTFFKRSRFSFNSITTGLGTFAPIHTPSI